MERLVGMRFKSLEELQKKIEEVTNRKVIHICYANYDMIEKEEIIDDIIDYEFEDDGDVYELYYLKDHRKNIYVTEV